VRLAPGIPHALSFQGEEYMQDSRAMRGERVKLFLAVIARSQQVARMRAR
jgi:hypothetical protein